MKALETTKHILNAEIRHILWRPTAEINEFLSVGQCFGGFEGDKLHGRESDRSGRVHRRHMAGGPLLSSTTSDWVS